MTLFRSAVFVTEILTLHVIVLNRFVSKDSIVISIIVYPAGSATEK